MGQRDVEIQFIATAEQATRKIRDLRNETAALGGGFEDLNRGAAKATGGVTGLSEKYGDLVGKLKAVMAAGSVIATGAWLAREFADAGSRVQDLSAKLEVSSQFLQEMSYAGSLVGVSFDKTSTAMLQLQKNVVENSKQTATALDRIGLSVENLRGLNPEQLFTLVAQRVGEIQDPVRQAATAMELFGRGGKEILGLLRSDLGAAREEAQRLGAVMGDDMVARADALGDAGTRVSEAWQGFKRMLGDTISSALGLTEALNGLADAVGAVNRATTAGEGGVGLAGWVKAAMASYYEAQSKLLGLGGQLKGTPGAAAHSAAMAQALRDEIAASMGGAKGNGPDLVRVPGTEMFVTQQAWAQMEAAGNAYAAQIEADAKKEATKAKRQLEQQARDAAALREALFAAGSSQVAHLFAGPPTSMLRQGGPAFMGAGKYTNKPFETELNTLGMVFPAIERVKTATFDWSRALGDLSHSFELLGGSAESALGKALTLLSVGMAGSQQVNQMIAGHNLYDQQTGALLKQGQWGDLSRGEKFGAAAAGVGVLAGAYQGGSVLGGAAGGAAFGSTFGPIGAGIGALVGGLAGLFGGGAKDKKEFADLVASLKKDLPTLREQAERFGISLDKALASGSAKQLKAALEQIGEATEAQQKRMAGLGTAAAGLNLLTEGMKFGRPAGDDIKDYYAKVKGEIDAMITGAGGEGNLSAAQKKELETKRYNLWVTGHKIEEGVPSDSPEFQAQVGRVGMYAAGVFGGLVSETGDVISALEQIGPTLDALREHFKATGTTGSAAVQQLLGMREVLVTNEGLAQQISGLQQLMKGLGEAGYVTADMLSAFGADATSQFHALMEGGADANQAFAIMQPTLQQLWEQQKQFGTITDESTLSLLQQAEAMGLVGDDMRTGLSAVVDVLKDIRDAILGIPTDRKVNVHTNYTQSGNPPPGGGGGGGDGGDGGDGNGDPGLLYGGIVGPRWWQMPRAAAGILVPSRPGRGTAVIMGEGGSAEVAIPVNTLMGAFAERVAGRVMAAGGAGAGGGAVPINLTVHLPTGPIVQAVLMASRQGVNVVHVDGIVRSR